MPIRLECPRCKRPLAIPTKKAGSYVNCPSCKGRFWVPDESPNRSEAARTAVEGDPAAPAVGDSGSSLSLAEIARQWVAGGSTVASLPADAPPEPAPAPTAATAAGSEATLPSGPAGGWTVAGPIASAATAPLPAAAAAPIVVPPEAAVAPPPFIGGGPSLQPQAIPAPPAGAIPMPPMPPMPSPLPVPPAAAPAAMPPRPLPVPPAFSAPAVSPVPTFPAPRVPQPPMAPAIAPAAAPRPPAVPAAPAARKVAKFITAEAATSALAPAADGKLPELQLDEGRQAETAKTKTAGSNPLLLVMLLCISIVLSIVFAVVGPSESDTQESRAKSDARRLIEENYFAKKGKPLEPYQLLLREAQQAHNRGDLKTERQRYRKVLGLLRAERETFQRGLTGSMKSDQTLEELITRILGPG